MINPNIIEGINTIPIFDVMNVRGYCVYIEGILRTFIYAEDIAREAGLVRERSKTVSAQMWAEKTYTYEGIRWDRFNHYLNLSLPAIERKCPEILPLIQLPIHRYSYIPAEVALIVLMHCESDKAVEFQVVLACKIMPEIQQHAIRYYEEQIGILENEIYDYQEMIDCNNINKMKALEEEIDLYKRVIQDYEGVLGDKCYSFLTPSTLERMKNIVK